MALGCFVPGGFSYCSFLRGWVLQGRCKSRGMLPGERSSRRRNAVTLVSLNSLTTTVFLKFFEGVGAKLIYVNFTLLLKGLTNVPSGRVVNKFGCSLFLVLLNIACLFKLTR